MRGLLTKELRSRSRGWRPAGLLTGYLGFLTLAVAGFLALSTSGSIPTTLGMQLFSALAMVAVVLLAFIMPALTVGAISGERERRTLDLLLVTRASPLGLASGKLLGSLFYILFLLVASLPAFALVYLFGGVPLHYLLLVLLVIAVTALTHASLGLLLSAVLHRTLLASVVTYLVVLVLVLGIPFSGLVAGGVGGVAPFPRAGSTRPEGMVPPTEIPHAVWPPNAYIYVSPLPSLWSVLPTTPFGGSATPMAAPLVGPGGAFSSSYMAPGALATQPSGPITQSAYVVARDSRTGQGEAVIAGAPWVYHLVFSAVLILLSLLGATLMLAPSKPWQARRLRRRGAVGEAA